jgi:hypothetical protein
MRIRAEPKMPLDTGRQFMPRPPNPEKPKPSFTRVRTLMDNMDYVVPYITQGQVRGIEVDTSKGVHDIRKVLVRVFRFKALKWELEKNDERASEGFKSAPRSTLGGIQDQSLGSQEEKTELAWDI